MKDDTTQDERATDARPADADERERAAGAAEVERAGTASARDISPQRPSGTGAAEVEHDLDALLADVKRERDEYLQLAQRARADFENYRKRAARETQDAERRGKASVARELLPALDNLERALKSTGLDPATGRPAADSEPTSEEQDAEAYDTPSEEVSAQEALARGVALVYGELRSALERAGVETYDPAGEPFDPTTSEALATRSAGDGAESGRVIETLERGYRLDGHVLRPARVVVSE
ncbi:MAG: nucleotide exchange factor GrpE [Solirubrobacterales bacterium]